MAAGSKENSGSGRVLSILWRNWAVTFGAITLPLLLALFIPRLWLPFVCLVEAWVLAAISKAVYNKVTNTCSLIMKVVSKVMVLSAIIMFAIYILCTDWVLPTVIHLKLYNSEIPFITSLVIFPITIVACCLWLYGGFAENYCRQCQSRNGYYAGDSIEATLYYRETRYQLSILLLLSIVIGAVEYWYYFERYINSDLNTPDRFFFNYIPIAMYLLSLFFMGGRYTSMRTLYEAIEDKHGNHRNRTAVRFLIFCDDELLLHHSADELWDTPAEATINRTSSLGQPQAELLFNEITGLQAPAMRYCFTNAGFATGSNMVHYAVFVDQDQKEKFTNEDVWFNPYMLDSAMASSMLSPILANELFRILTITMAWKTYDRDGKRLYPIRHYRPTFRLRDLRHWTVDYDDESWFDVANNNEDRRFFRFRALVNRLTGVFNRKASAEQ